MNLKQNLMKIHSSAIPFENSTITSAFVLYEDIITSLNLKFTSSEPSVFESVITNMNTYFDVQIDILNAELKCVSSLGFPDCRISSFDFELGNQYNDITFSLKLETTGEIHIAKDEEE